MKKIICDLMFVGGCGASVTGVYLEFGLSVALMAGGVSLMFLGYQANK